MNLDAVGAGQPQGGFDFELLGVTGSSLLSSSLGSADIDALLTLDPGDYRVFAFARADSLDGATAFGASSFSFVLSATELEALPPGNVPEPASLALALSGLLACGVLRRRSRVATM